MKRFKVLFGQRRFQVLATLAVVLVAAAVVVGSGASFTSQSANAANVFSSGTLAMTNTPTGMTMSIPTMVPGESHTGTVVIKNTGDVQGHFYLEPVVISADTAPNSTMTGATVFADKLHLNIKDGSYVVYDGSLSGLTQTDLDLNNASVAPWAASESHTYPFVVTLPDTGTTAGVNSAGVVGSDNQYMGASTTAAFNWTTVSVMTNAQGTR